MAAQQRPKGGRVTPSRLARQKYQEMCHAWNHGPRWLAEAYAAVMLEPLPVFALCPAGDVLKWRAQAQTILRARETETTQLGAVG